MPTAQLDQQHKAIAFRDLHHHGSTFVLANAWDAGSARVLARCGFVALGTTSAGLAHALGRRDGGNLVSRQETLDNARAIAEACDLPVSADLERCFADTADGVGDTITAAAAAGLVGASLEDATGDLHQPIYPLETAVERVRAAVAAARALPFPFTLTARAENFLHGVEDLEDTVRRLQAYAVAGADVLYAPGLPDLDAIARVCASVDRPVNALCDDRFSLAQLRDAGVARVSVGSGFARAAYGAVQAFAEQIRNAGRFDAPATALPYGDLQQLMTRPGD
jgi:2-methylisocitrate lyase-like PEP mutase family enzyme